MSRRRVSGPAQPVYVYPWYHISGEAITPGGVSQQVNIPDGATIVELRPEGGSLYFAINSTVGAASAASGGYVADGSGEIIGPLANLNRLDVYMDVDSTVHIMFFREYE